MHIIWDLEDEPGGNYQHIIEHDVSPEEVEEVLNNPANSTGTSRSSGQPITFGWTSTGKHLAVIWELVEEEPRTAYPITAYPVPERRSRR